MTRNDKIMNILLLGGTGYLGGHIAKKLVDEGHNVICVVRNTSNTDRLEYLNIQFVSNEFGELRLVFKHNRIDWVINAVCTYTVNDDNLYGDMLESNLIFPLGVLNMGIKYGVKNYISLGTSLPSDFNFYSFTKGKFSDFGQYLCKTDDFNFADLKLEMFYGDTGRPKSRFIDICISKLLNNEELLLTSGYQKRDIIHVNDVVEIISRIIISNFVEGYKQLPVGTGEHHSIKEIVLYLKDEIGSDSELKFGAIKDRKNEPDTLADISWLKIIDYQLKYGYFEGLKSACISRGGVEHKSRKGL